MGQHARGRLGPAGRCELVRLLLVVGVSEREAATATPGVSSGARRRVPIARGSHDDVAVGTGRLALVGQVF
jgi:hypothetical protein